MSFDTILSGTLSPEHIKPSTISGFQRLLKTFCFIVLRRIETARLRRVLNIHTYVAYLHVLRV